MKKKPMRSCIVTLEKLEKKDLIRIVKNKEGQVFVDLTGKANGRGAYLKRDKEVIKKCKKNKILDRKLGIEIPDDIYEELDLMIE
ncbi:MAG: YlxR family protein [Bacilli bacterium]|nr:YlxR family protein [Bacilli bacterium]